MLSPKTSRRRTHRWRRAACLIIGSLGWTSAACDDTLSEALLSESAGPPPALPAAARTYLSYSPDGNLRVDGGVSSSPRFRPSIIDAIPKVAAYGFGRYATISYIGVARSPADAAGYFGPIADAADAAGIRFVPGMWLHSIFANVYGPEDQVPWNVTGDEAHLHHPMNPSGLLDQAFWDDFVIRVRILAQGARADQVYVDSEYVFWQNKDDPFWSDENLAAIKMMFRAAVAELQRDNVFLIMYHPMVLPTSPPITRIAQGLTSPVDGNDPLNAIEHFAPAPYWSYATWTLPEPPEIDGWYMDAGFPNNVVRYGFISQHAVFVGGGGFTPEDYDAYCNARAGIA
ncbi:MAG: hypothetical protein V3T70_06285, partial [Phycisphaerae bacterium]